MIRRVSRTRVSYVVQDVEDYGNTKHHAPVQTLALDTDASTGSGSSRGGILYSGGRDGAVLSWDTNLALDYAPTVPPSAPLPPTSIASRVPSSSYGSRGHRYSLSNSSSQLQMFRQEHGRVNSISGELPGTTPSPSLSDPGAVPPMSGDFVATDGTAGRHVQLRAPAKPPQLQSQASRRTFSISSNVVPQQPGIAVETQRRRFTPEKSTHRTSYLGHSDWVNDVVLVNGNRGFVSGSSDRTLLLWPCQPPSYPYPDPAWNPTPSPIGAHSDYVRALAYSPHQNWIASGGLDRRICLWDLGEGRKDPLKSMWGVPLPQEAATSVFTDTPAHSIYTLATPSSGSIIVSGSPERVVRVWDPRTPTTRRVFKLTGHTDNVRSVLVSTDGRWVLSASSDATVKLWSLAQPSRCVITYTHFADSVWTLHSNHPDLETFWAGGKDGIVCKVNRNPPGRGLDSDVDEVGDVVVVCKENGGINKIVAIDDLYVFTAVSNSSAINRWKDVPLRVSGTPYLAASGAPSPLVSSSDQQASAGSPTSPQPPSLSFSSTPRMTSSAPVGALVGPPSENSDLWEPVPIPALAILRPASTSLAFASFMPTGDATSTRAGSSNRAFRSSSISGVAPQISDVMFEGDARSAFMYDADDDSDDDAPAEPVFKEPEEVIAGKVGIVNIFLCNDKRRVISEDADGVVTMWDITKCKKLRTWNPEPSISTTAPSAKGPSLYLSDETGVKSKNPLFQQVVAQENTLDFVGTWCALDNKTGAITVHLEENRCFDAEAYWDDLVPEPIPQLREEFRVNIGKWILAYLFQNFRAGCLHPDLPRPVQPRLLSFARPGETLDDDQSEVSGGAGLDTSSIASSALHSESGVPVTRTVTDASSVSNGVAAGHGGITVPPTARGPVIAAGRGSMSSSPSQAALDSGDLQASPHAGPSAPAPAAVVPPSPGGSFMDKLKLHMRRRTTSNTDASKDGKSPKQSTKAEGSIEASSLADDSAAQEPQHPSDVNYRDTPVLDLPPDVPVIVSVEESSEASSFLDLYRGTICSMGNLEEVERLKQVIPTWVYEFTVEGKANVKETQKMAFQMFAYPDCGLPELPSGNNRLSANRMLRIRKLLNYIAEKLELDPVNPRNSASKYVPVNERVSGMKPEAYLEMWVNDKPLTPKTTLATIRNYYWKQGGDVMLHYRPTVRR